MSIVGRVRAKRVAVNIRIMREQAGLSMCELADLLGTTAATVSRWESGRNAISLEKVFDIADALDISHHALMDINFKEQS